MRRGGAAVVAALLTCAAVLVAPAPAARAAACPAPGGKPHPFTTDPAVAGAGYDLILNGGGWGHGIGMSQFGAQGAALLGCSYTDILATYYPTTSVLGRPSRGSVAVMLRTTGLDVRTRIRTSSKEFGGADLPWVACNLAATSCPQVATQPAGSTWSVVGHANGVFDLRDEATGAVVWSGGNIETRLRLRHDGRVIRVLESVPSGSHDPQGLRSKWGFVEFDATSAHGGLTFVTQYVTGGASGLSAMDTYLLGLDEVPASWQFEAQAAQAVAGRSYAEASITSREVYRTAYGYMERTVGGTRCRCEVVPTTSDQFWNGYEHETEDTQGIWRQAIVTTRDRYVVTGDGKVATTFYSSSHGDHSSASKDIWSADLPYLQAVDTSAWEDASMAQNSRMRWSRGFTADWLAARFGLDRFDRLEIVARDAAGRPRKGGVVVTGTKGGSVHQLTFGAEQIRSKLGVNSGLIRLEGDPGPAPPEPAPRPGDAIPAVRLKGSERVATSVAVSAHGWKTSATVVIARSDHAADALAGSGLAGALGAPLLINPPGSLHPAVAKEVGRLGATTAILLGGEAALSKPVADALAEDTSVETVERLQGRTRVETATAIARRLAPDAGGQAIVIRGIYPEHPDREWADALAVAGMTARRAAHAGERWVVVVAGAELYPESLAALEELGTANVRVAGGTATVPAKVEASLTGAGFTVRPRIAGANRYETSRAAATLDAAPAGPLIIATGAKSADGLSAGALAGRLNGTLLLVPTRGLATLAGHEDWIRAHAASFTDVIVIGGEGAVSADTVARVRDRIAEGRAAG